MEQAKQIKYTLELLQKDETGDYKEAVSDITAYLPTVTTPGDKQFTEETDKKSMTLTKGFDISEVTQRDFIYINLTPLTGEVFESNKFTYANYKVRLTAVLLGENEKELDGTKASDYIIYTNARIYQQMIS